MHALMFCEDEAVISKRTKLIASISGCEKPVVLKNTTALGFPRCEIKLKRVDLLIIQSLRHSPRKATSQVARKVGVSVRTVEIRLAYMTYNRAFFHIVRMDFHRIDGVASSIIVKYLDDGFKRRLDRMIRSRLEGIFFSVTGRKETSQFNFVCKIVAEFEMVRDWIRDLDGVTLLKSGTLRECILVSDWIDNQIERMLGSQWSHG